MSSICCCCNKQPELEYSGEVSYGAFNDGLPIESDVLTQAAGHYRARSLIAPLMQSMSPPPTLLPPNEPIVESGEVAQLKALLDHEANENRGLQTQLEAERKKSVALARMNKDLSFECEERSQQLDKFRTELEVRVSEAQDLERELQKNIASSQKQVEEDSEKSREIERLKNKLLGKERDLTRLAVELQELKNRQSTPSLSEQSPSRRNSIDDRGKLQSANEELKRVRQELEQLHEKYTDLTKHLRVIPVLEQKIRESDAEFSQKEEDLKNQVSFWKSKVALLTTRNGELIDKLVKAGVIGYGMHKRRSSSLTR